MRNAVLKWMLIIAAVLFADLIIMIIAGCFSGLCHASNNFFCTIYCYFGIGLFTVSVILTIYLILRKKNHA
jgi:Na+-driven multidrug efflux pump